MLPKFDTLVLPHLDAAYNLARWLCGNDDDAARVTEDALLRAHELFPTFRGERPKAWLLAIVRQTWQLATGADDDALPAPPDRPTTWDAHDGAHIDAALAKLPAGYRELLVLRDLESLHYPDIAAIAGVTPATVMSRLESARQLLATTVAMLGREHA